MKINRTTPNLKPVVKKSAKKVKSTIKHYTRAEKRAIEEAKLKWMKEEADRLMTKEEQKWLIDLMG